MRAKKRSAWSRRKRNQNLKTCADPPWRQLQPPTNPQETSSAPASRGTQTSASGAPVDRIEMSRVLEQLRELGALREAGYVTEEEFEQLKKKILDSAL